MSDPKIANRVTRADFARACGISATAVYKAVKRGDVVVTTIGEDQWVDMRLPPNADYLRRHGAVAPEPAKPPKPKRGRPPKPKTEAAVKRPRGRPPRKRPAKLDAPAPTSVDVGIGSGEYVSKVDVEIEIKKVELRKKSLDYLERVGELVPREAVLYSIGIITSAIEEQFGSLDQRVADSWHAMITGGASVIDLERRIRDECVKGIRQVQESCQREIRAMERGVVEDLEPGDLDV